MSEIQYLHPSAAPIHEGICFTPVYNRAAYARLNPDLDLQALDDQACFDHFLHTGIPGGRLGCDTFDPHAYRFNNPALDRRFGDEWSLYYWHYLRTGLGQGLSGQYDCYLGVCYAKVYQPGYYKQFNPDLAAAFGADMPRYIQHFVTCGMREGRIASPYFNVYAYRWRYDRLYAPLPDLQCYFLAYRKQQTDTPDGADSVCDGVDYAPVYDYTCYRALNPDVAAALGDESARYLRHFLDYGMAEGRIANTEFDVHRYRAEHPELQQQYGGYWPAYYQHHIKQRRG